MSCIHTLDLSYTNIKFLPEFISKFVALRVFNLKGCQLLTELVPEIGDLINLEEFDLEGNEIICLPEEISKRINLRSLKFSLCSYADQFQETKRIGSIIPRKALSNLLKLNELCIDVNPGGDWWNNEVRGVIDDLCCLKELNTLRLSMSTVDLLDNLIQHFMRLIYGTAPTFRFDPLDNLVRRFMPSTSGTAPQFRLTVGHHEECLVSRLPKDLIEEFHNLENFEKGLKYINSEGIPIDVKNALKHVDALFLERHWSINNLLEFGLENIDELRFCILLECNELQAAIDAKQSKDFDQRILGSLEHLSIH